MKLIKYSIIFFLLGIMNLNADQYGCSFLKIDSGVISPAMAGAVTSLDNRSETLFYNPAGTASIDQLNISGTYSKWLAHTSYLNFIIITSFSKIGTFGISSSLLFYSDIPVVTQKDDGSLIETFDTTLANDFLFNLNYSRQINNMLFGINIKHISESLENESVSFLALDVGTILKIVNNKAGIGISVQNLSSSSKIMEQSFNLPVTGRIGIHYLILFSNNKFSLLPLIDVIKVIDDDLNICPGAEFVFNNLLSLRMGYKIGHDLEKLTSGAGIKLQRTDYSISINYSLSTFSDFGLTHQFGFNLIF